MHALQVSDLLNLATGIACAEAGVEAREGQRERPALYPVPCTLSLACP